MNPRRTDGYDRFDPSAQIEATRRSVRHRRGRFTLLVLISAALAVGAFFAVLSWSSLHRWLDIEDAKYKQRLCALGLAALVAYASVFAAKALYAKVK
jgi:hypothetical protein